MAKKTLSGIVATPVKSKIAIIALICVILVSASVIISTLLGADLPGKLMAMSGPKPTAFGYCVYGADKYGRFDGEYTSAANCFGKTKNEKPNWQMYCPGIFGVNADNSGDTYCNCATPGTTPVRGPIITEAIGKRQDLIERLNDGEITEQDKDDELHLQWAVALNCACDVYGSGNKPNASTTIYQTGQLPGDDPGEIVNLSGQFDFISRLNKLLSRLTVYNSNSFTCSDPFPGCRISRTVGTSYSVNHTPGLAADICCDVEPYPYPANTENQCNNPRVADTINRVSGQGFSIIRECTKQERGCNDTFRCLEGLVHIDRRDRSEQTPPFSVGGMFQTNCISRAQ